MGYRRTIVVSGKWDTPLKNESGKRGIIHFGRDASVVVTTANVYIVATVIEMNKEYEWNNDEDFSIEKGRKIFKYGLEIGQEFDEKIFIDKFKAIGFEMRLSLDWDEYITHVGEIRTYSLGYSK